MTKTQKMAAIASAVFIGTAVGASYWFLWPIHRAESLVRKQLIDPDSAKFNDVVLNRSKGSVCGYVNSKNKFGGYTGKTPFAVAENGDVYFDPGELPTRVPGITLDQLTAGLKALDFLIDHCQKEVK